MTVPLTSITLINRFLPPSPGITGREAFALAAELRAVAPTLTFNALGTDRRYGGGADDDGAESTIPTRRIPASPRRWGPLDRAVTTALDGRTLAIWAANGAAATGGDGVVLSLTDPPMLGHWLARRLPRDRAWVEWTMDSHPQAILAALRIDHTRLPGWLMAPPGRRPDSRLHLGPRQAAALAAWEAPSPPPPWLVIPAGVIPAGGIPVGEGPRADDPTMSGGGRRRLLYAGNLGRAHDPAAIAALIDAVDPVRHHLTIAAHGPGAERVGALARRAADRVTLAPHPLPRSALLAADVHVVSLRSRWTHVSVPSKAVTALCLGKPILFIGDGASDVWGWARTHGTAGWRVAPDQSAAATRDALRQALEEIATPDRLRLATLSAALAGDHLRRVRAQGVAALAEWLVQRSGGDPCHERSGDPSV